MSVGDKAILSQTAVNGTDAAPERMSARERSDVQQLARMNGRVAKSDVDAVVAERYREFVEELTRDWSAEELHVTELIAEANAKVALANEEILRRCAAEGIRPELRPMVGVSLYLRPRVYGDTLRELKMKAQAELDAAGKRAKTEIDRSVALICSQVIGAGLTSAEARLFLDRVPSPHELVQPLDARTFGRRPELTAAGES